MRAFFFFRGLFWVPGTITISLGLKMTICGGRS